MDYGRGAGVERGLGDGLSLGDAQYLPPLSKAVKKEPPQTIISLPVQIVVCEARAEGTSLVVLVAVQLSMLALYLPPVFKSVLLPTPPQTDHFTTRPYCRVGATAFRHVRATSSRPVVRVGIVSAASGGEHSAAPDNHFTAGPHCGVASSCGGRVRGTRRRPTVRIRIISPASIHVVAEVVGPAPDDHFTAGPHCGVPLPGGRRIDCSSSGPSVRNRIVSATSV